MARHADLVLRKTEDEQMRIRMYNVGFGDCFCIRDRKSSLLVDFGAANSKIEGHPRREVFDVIISDLTTISKKNLLLTHFHPDHVSGLLYMMRYRSDAYEFGKIYLPDVFSRAEMKYTLALLLLADVTKKASLPGRRLSLLALADALCTRNVEIELLSRGSQFEEKYTALWPDTDVVYRETEEVFMPLLEIHEKAVTELVDIGEEVRRIFMKMTEKEENDGKVPGEENEEEQTQEAAGTKRRRRITPASLEKRFRKLQATPEFQALLETAELEGPALREFRHKISLAFHNTRDGELNMLFTGDVQPAYLQKIRDDYDGKLPLHEHYWCVKVPHHGTESHYFDFRDFSPENLLIPNGAYYDNSKKKSKNQRTSARYGGLFYIPDTHMYCSSCDCCDSYRDGCSCKEYDILSPAYYKDI